MNPKFQPGVGGWPTVRYFNSETGYDGAPYNQKTDKSMCDELGDMTYMRAYVEEKGIKPCNVNTLAHCNDKQSKFVATWKAKTGDQRNAEIARLDKMGQTLVATSDIMNWHRQRLAILRDLVKHDEL